MKVAVGLRRVAAGKRTSGRRAAQIAEAAKKELGKGIRADELLAGEVISVSWKKGICHMTAELHRDRDFS